MTQSLHRQLQLWEIGDKLDHKFCVSLRRALKSVLKLGNICLHRIWSSADVVLHYPVSVYDDECMTFFAAGLDDQKNCDEHTESM